MLSRLCFSAILGPGSGFTPDSFFHQYNDNCPDVYRSIRQSFVLLLGPGPPTNLPLMKISGSAHALSEYYDNDNQC